jgi:hypothetical protein
LNTHKEDNVNKFLNGAAYLLMNEAGADGGDAGAGAGGDAAAADKGAQGGGDKAAAAADAGGDSLLAGIEDDGADGADGAAIDFTKGKPEWMSDEAWDAEKKAPKADILAKELKAAQDRAKGLRDKLAKGENKVPKDVKEYAFTPSEKGKAAFTDGDPSKDPVVQAVAPIALKHGLSKEQYAGFMADVSEVLADMAERHGAQVTELTPEQKAEIRANEMKKIGANGVQVTKAVGAFINTIRSNGGLSENGLKAVQTWIQTAEDVKAMNELRAYFGGGHEIPSDGTTDGLPSDEEIAQLITSVKTEADQQKVDDLLNRRRAAGRPDKLNIRM